jgi:hypothetical protein
VPGGGIARSGHEPDGRGSVPGSGRLSLLHISHASSGTDPVSSGTLPGCEAVYNSYPVGLSGMVLTVIKFRDNFVNCICVKRPPLWSSGQSSWLQIRRPGFDSRHYQRKKVVGLERGPLNLVSATEELQDRKVAAPV